MKLELVRQETNSRGELLLRSLFGWLYIMIPHGFVLGFVGFWGAIRVFFAWWAVLFTGKYPEGTWNYMVKLINWELRLIARMSNLLDGYPALGMNKTDEKVIFEAVRPEKLSVGDLILKTLFGYIYVGIPHGIAMGIRGIGTIFVMFIAWWVILFTGKLPESMFNYIIGYYRWSIRLSMYYGFWMSDKYPPFNGQPDPEQPIAQ